MAQTAIEWTATRLADGTVLPGYTFNGWEGCQKVGPGCDNCYAEARNIRFTGGINWGPHAPRRRTSAANWRKPIKWNAEAARSGIRRNVFCSSLADVMDNHASILSAWRADLAALILATPHLNWLLLTKRIGNAEKYLHEMFPAGVPSNVWLGITVVTQAEADKDGPKLAKIKAAFGISVTFFSMEPLLEAVTINPICMPDWVIVGGESGHNARPMHPNWPRSIRDQCVAAGMAFFFKQWGEFAVDEIGPEDARSTLSPPGHVEYLKIGKKAAGRKLDGRTWDQMPGAAA